MRQIFRNICLCVCTYVILYALFILSDNNTREMKRHILIVGMHAKYSDVKIERLFWKTLIICAKISEGVGSCSETQKSITAFGQHYGTNVRTTGPYHYRYESRYVLEGHCQVFMGRVYNVVHEDNRYESYVIRKVQFIPALT